MNNFQKTLETLYLDYFNNFLTIEGFAEYYGISEQLAKQIIKEVQTEYIYNQPKK